LGILDLPPLEARGNVVVVVDVVALAEEPLVLPLLGLVLVLVLVEVAVMLLLVGDDKERGEMVRCEPELDEGGVALHVLAGVSVEFCVDIGPMASK